MPQHLQGAAAVSYTHLERPVWKQLVADIEAGKVAHVIVKDMSRAGRDYLQTGFYTEVFLPVSYTHLDVYKRQVCGMTP